MQEQETLESVVSTLKVRVTSTRITPTAERAKEWPGASHYRVTVTYGGRSMRTVFSQGSAYSEPPSVVAVIGSLARDMLNGATFDQWCRDLGYDTDSRKADRVYKACKRIEASMRRVFGDELAERLNRAEW